MGLTEPIELTVMIERLGFGPDAVHQPNVLTHPAVTFVVLAEVAVLGLLLVTGARDEMDRRSPTAKVIEACELSRGDGGRDEPWTMRYQKCQSFGDGGGECCHHESVGLPREVADQHAVESRRLMQPCCIGDRVVIEREETEETTAGGIVLPDSAREKSQRGKVKAIGEGKLLDNGSRVKPDVKKGDVVLFGKYAGTDVEVEGVEYKIVRETEILGKIGG